ncbi:MAG TPA: ATP-grasp fold amidoligase family protein [Hyphomicrobiales bacterium]|nr:ATP-grasp fold amidoligase family protein [Hyphomicrobiales bacterium]
MQSIIKRSRQLRERAEAALLDLRIGLKFRSDRRYLPLTAGHFDLYRTVHRHSYRELGRFPDLVACRDLNDMINWSKLFDQNPAMVDCTDKLGVRDYVAARVGPQHLTEIFQVRDHFAGIDFEALPKSFVVKTNNDSGTVIVVPDKDELDRAEAERLVERALSQVYGAAHGEWAYAHIVPKVFVEENLADQNGASPPDYKFFCAGGKVTYCSYLYGRGTARRAQAIDPMGNDTGLNAGGFPYGSQYSRPDNWERMIEVAETLAADFKLVRVDIYSIGERIVVGEMTFWPLAGAFKGPDLPQISRLIDFDRTSVRPPYRAKDR